MGSEVCPLNRKRYTYAWPGAKELAVRSAQVPTAMSLLASGPQQILQHTGHGKGEPGGANSEDFAPSAPARQAVAVCMTHQQRLVVLGPLGETSGHSPRALGPTDGSRLVQQQSPTQPLWTAARHAATGPGIRLVEGVGWPLWIIISRVP